MKLTCPSCSTEFPIEAGLLEDDAKRLATIAGEMEPMLWRAAILYLRLFKPAKTALRVARAIKILIELRELVGAGTVCRDERNGLHRPAPIAAWVAGIEQMLQRPEALRLPLSNHNYLRQVVWGIADQADAQAERDREKALRTNPRRGASIDPLQKMHEHLNWLKQQCERGFLSQEQHDQQAAETRAKYSGDQS